MTPEEAKAARAVERALEDPPIAYNPNDVDPLAWHSIKQEYDRRAGRVLDAISDDVVLRSKVAAYVAPGYEFKA